MLQELYQLIRDSKIEDIKVKLNSDFEREVFDASIKNLLDANNDLWLNNFAYAMREVINVYLANLAADADISNCHWYKTDLQYQKKYPPGEPNLKGKLTYVLVGNLPLGYVEKNLKIDFEKKIKELIKSYNTLSKFTHISRKSFRVKDLGVAKEILEHFHNFMKLIIDIQKELEEALESSIYDDLGVDELYTDLQAELDTLSTHTTMDDYTIEWVEDVIVDPINCGIVRVDFGGTLSCDLRYGSESDVDRGDGISSGIGIEFSASLNLQLENDKWRIAEWLGLDIYTDDFFGGDEQE